MTPKERRDAQIELRDWATELQYARPDGSSREKMRIVAENTRRAAFLRLIADELERVPTDAV